LIQLTRRGVVINGSTADLRGLRAQFHRDHYAILPKLIEPDLLATIVDHIESAPQIHKEFDGIIRESVIDDPLIYNLFLFLLEAPEFQRLVQRITGCRRIARFQGRIYMLNPSTEEQIVWHTDVTDHRMVTLSLNLTRQEYRGGTLQMRYRNSNEILHEIRNTGLGDALIMRVSKNLAHRVLPVEGDVPRTGLAGWFRWEKENVNLHQAWREASKVTKKETAEKESSGLTAG
jgi:hypothetical protein